MHYKNGLAPRVGDAITNSIEGRTVTGVIVAIMPTQRIHNLQVRTSTGIVAWTAENCLRLEDAAPAAR